MYSQFMMHGQKNIKFSKLTFVLFHLYSTVTDSDLSIYSYYSSLNADPPKSRIPWTNSPFPKLDLFPSSRARNGKHLL